MLLVLLTPVLLVAGIHLSPAWLLPVLVAVPAWVVMARRLMDGLRGEAIALVSLWAFLLAASGIAATVLWPDKAAAVILNGTAYRDEMFGWLASGEGRESSPSIFIPQHLLHAAIFCILSLATASTASLVMGAMLMNYMSFYVGELILRCAASGDLPAAILLGWNPWSALRVLSFIALGVVLSEPLLTRFTRTAFVEGRLRWIAAACAGLLLDILMKSLLSPFWPRWLGVCVIDAGVVAP